MLTNKQIKKILAKADIISEDAFDKFLSEALKNGKKTVDYLIEKKIITPLSLYESAAKYFKLPFINLKGVTIRKDILFTIPEPIALTHQLIAFDGNDKEIKLATTNPDNLQIFEFINKKTGLKPIIHLTTPDSIKEHVKQYHKNLKSEFKYLTKNDSEEDNKAEKNPNNLKKMAEDLPVVRIVDTLLEYAVYQDASDIHIEPEEKDVIVRYRIDGILQTVMTLPKNTQSGIIARIKILANLKVDEHRMPQDGRFKISTEEIKVAFRVSILPAFDGEKIVMRLLNEKGQILNIEQLGFQSNSLQIIKKNIKKPHGMILVTGPTGSGKTTSLYTILNILNTPEVNISTVEDPIEYRMQRINQSQINPKIGFTFAIGLRALLRQDPDIIMIGEIRDEETAEIAVHAAMTGHLVLSTLHTNDAPTTLPRLNDMGIPSFLIATTVNVIVAQRLVRKICPHCIQSYNLSEENINELKKQFNTKDLINTLVKEKIVSKPKNGLDSLLFYRGKGCSKCNNSGYKGRIGIYETLEITEEMSSLILKKAGTDEIKKQAIKQGMITISEDGFIKAKNGITTIEEVMRVTKE
jgi:type IV pilus assembly protein PilB